MKKIISIVIGFLLALCVAAPSYAIPAKPDIVLDSAHVFTQYELAQLQKGLKGNRYHYYLLTTTNLENLDPYTYSDKVAKDWGLGKQDVLFVLHINPTLDRLYITTPEDGEPDKLLKTLPVDSDGDTYLESFNQEFADHHFLLAAKRGDYVYGILDSAYSIEWLSFPLRNARADAALETASTVSVILRITLVLLGVAVTIFGIYKLKDAWAARNKLR